MKILVTGGAGFIGSNLCEHLLDKAYKVICLDNLSTGSKNNIINLLPNKNFKFIKGDIRNYEDCQLSTENVDFVFHQAALGSVPRSLEDPITSTDVNISGFAKMLFASQEAGVKRFIYAASSSTYGDEKSLPKKEDKIGSPLSPYAITKFVNELYAENFSSVYGIETIGLRYFNVFGKRQDPNGPYAAVIPKFIISLLNHKQPIINGDGNHSRDFTYIDNVLNANYLSMIGTSEKVFSDSNHQIFNVAYGEETNINTLFELISENLSYYDKKIKLISPKHGSARKGDVKHSLACIKKAKKHLNYSPEFDIKKGLINTCNWYIESL